MLSTHSVKSSHTFATFSFSSVSSLFYSSLLFTSPLACVSAAYFCMFASWVVGRFLSSTINGRLPFPLLCVCLPVCTHASSAGVFVTEKNALKLSLMSVKTKQMVFKQPSEKRKKRRNAVAMNFWKIHMLLQKDSNAHKRVGVDVGWMTEGFWFPVKGVMVFPKNQQFFLFFLWK